VVVGKEQHWLLGDSSWWPNSEGRLLVTRIGDLNPPKSWVSTDPNQGGIGWIRQRLQPVGPRILYTSAWSLFFLIASIVPLIFPEKTPINDQLLAIILFSISWSLTLIPFLWFSNANNEKFTLFPLDYISFFLGIIFFILHIIIDTKLGWIGFFFFFTAWFRTIRNIGDSLKVNSSRWLLPISSSFIPQETISQEWEISTNRFRNGIIATKSDGLGFYSAELTGISFRNFRFIAFSMVFRNRIIHDPFNINFSSNPQIEIFLSSPPLKNNGEKWPDFLIREIEEE
tara:strand:+ start:2060 stop:2914 length:855 start_codon:yes stop_codon:yes gene_type:complete